MHIYNGVEEIGTGLESPRDYETLSKDTGSPKRGRTAKKSNTLVKGEAA